MCTHGNLSLWRLRQENTFEVTLNLQLHTETFSNKPTGTIKIKHTWMMSTSVGFCGERVVPRPSPLCSPVSRTQMVGQTAYVFVCCIVVEMCLKPYSNAGCQSRRKGLPWPGLARLQASYLRILIVPILLVCPQPASFLRAVP